MDTSTGLPMVLHAEGPDPMRADKLALYAFLVGDWDTGITAYTPDGNAHHGEGEIHAGWILEGRAVQDVWMIPRRRDRKPDSPAMPVAGNWYGTTIRIYDPALDAWRIHWIDPATNSYPTQVGRKVGNDIVQEGKTESDMFSRWSFTEIIPNSFRWRGEASPDRATWRLVVEVSARRTRENTDAAATA